MTVLADSIYENDEAFTITFSNISNSSFLDGDGDSTRRTSFFTIQDDDAAPSITIDDVTTVDEGATDATFTVTLSGTSVFDTTVDYSTSDGTATAGDDYATTSGTLTIAAGATFGTFSVPIISDTTDEENETATITLSNATNATISDSTATLTITDDDVAPTLSFFNSEGNDQYIITEQDGTQAVEIRLSEASGKTVTVDYATSTTDSFPTFVAAEIDSGSTKDITLADIDNDGDLDIVSASGWFENDGAADPSFSDQGLGGATAIHVADIDNDGDLDLVAAYEGSDTIAWLENDGAANPSFNSTVISSSADYAFDVHVADIDGDGDLDIISASNNDDKIAWYENDGEANPTFTTAIIATTADEAREVFVGDVDNDGDLDIVSASRTDGAIAWYENNGASDPSFTATDIVNSTDGSGGKTDVHLADIDNDGDLDIVAADYDRNPVVWYENNGANNPSWTAQSIVGYPNSSPTVQHTLYGVGVHVDDLDNDGDLDIISAVTWPSSGMKVAWYENDGAANPGWTEKTLDTGKEFYEVASGDIDSDGDIDIVSAAYNGGITWYESDVASNNDVDVYAQVDDDYTATSGSVTFAPGETVKTFNVTVKEDLIPENNESVQVVLSSPTNATLEDSSGTVYITDDDTLVWTATDIVTNADDAQDVKVADIDGDGDLDIVSASNGDNTIAWYENDGAINPSFSKVVVATSADGAEGVYVADIDGDGDLDIVSASMNDDTIAWYENDGALDPSFEATNIVTNADSAYDVYVADIDGDGDLDIVSASYLDDTIAWYENDGASDPSFTKAVIATSADGAHGVYVADMDGDGDLDIFLLLN